MQCGLQYGVPTCSMKVSSQSAAWLYALKMERMTVFHVTLLSCSVWCNLVLYDAEIVSLCARVPPQTDFERTGGDGGFKISVDDDPELQLYAPGTVYQISITGSSLEHTISGAYIVAVPYNSSNENNTIGKFHLVDGGHLAFHVACSHIVTTVDNLPKAKVYVMWTSPTLGTGCVEFRYFFICVE